MAASLWSEWLPEQCSIIQQNHVHAMDCAVHVEGDSCFDISGPLPSAIRPDPAALNEARRRAIPKWLAAIKFFGLLVGYAPCPALRFFGSESRWRLLLFLICRRQGRYFASRPQFTGYQTLRRTLARSVLGCSVRGRPVSMPDHQRAEEGQAENNQPYTNANAYWAIALHFLFDVSSHTRAKCRLLRRAVADGVQESKLTRSRHQFRIECES